MVLRELLWSHQAFLSYAASHVHTLDLTLPQFDIIITLGNKAGMTFKKLGEKTLITKGTLTDNISRLEDKGLVQRVASETDGRSQIIRLTEAGNVLFERTFPEHLLFIDRIFNNYSPEDIATLESALLSLRKAVIIGRSDGSKELADKINGWCTKVKDVCKHYQDGSGVFNITQLTQIKRRGQRDRFPDMFRKRLFNGHHSTSIGHYAQFYMAAKADSQHHFTYNYTILSEELDKS